jgi:hypothetical protein
MANELTISASAQYEDDDGVTAGLEVAALTRTLTTKKVLKTKQTVGTSAEALVIGDVASLGFLMIINRDVTNFVSVLTGDGGDVVGKIFPGECYGPVRLGADMQAPFVQADTDDCEIEVLLCAV